MKVIYCAGEQARVVLDVMRRIGIDEDVTVLDDDTNRHGASLSGVDVAGGARYLDELDADSARCHVAFGDRQGVRLDIADRIEERGLELFTVIAPSATVSDSATVANGCFVNEQSYVAPDAELERTVLVDSQVNVSHDVVLSEGATVAPGTTIAGGTTVGTDAYLGAGVTVIDDIDVGAGAIVGAGAVVTGDVPPETTVVGIPAAPLN